MITLIVAGMMLFSCKAVYASASADDSQSIYETGSGGTIMAKAGERPGKVAFLYAKTYKTRKGLSKKKYKKNQRLVILHWTKASNANRYQIWYSYKKNSSYKKAMKKTIAGSPSGKWLTCKLSYKNNKTVYFKVTPYNGKTAGAISSWVSCKVGNTKKNAKSVKITGSNASIYAGDSRQYSASVSPAKSLEKQVRWISSNPSVAVVDSKGKVTGVGIGSSTIYALAHNGMKKSVKVTVKRPLAPKLLSLTMSSVDTSNKTASAQLRFQSIAGRKYRIYRRDNAGSYKQVAEMKASSKTATYTDKGLSRSGVYYTYTAKQVVGSGTRAVLGDYDSEGIMSLDAPQLKVKWNLTNSELSWDTVSGADGYDIYYRINHSGTSKKLTSLGSGVTSYKESSYITGSLKDNPTYLYEKVYRKNLDPAVNPLIYILRAKKTSSGKTSYYESEDFQLESPALAQASVNNGKVKISWSKVPLAAGYYIYAGKESGEKTARIGKVTQPTDANTVISREFSYDNNQGPYLTVEAYAYKNGAEIASKYDIGFRMKTEDFSGKKVLFIGDSIAYGTPYTGADSNTKPYMVVGGSSKYCFSYPRRIQQLTGVNITNVSVPGATYTYIDSNLYSSDYSNLSRRCLTATYDQMAKAKDEDKSYRNYAGNYESVEALKRGTSAVLNNTIDTSWNGKSPGRYSDYDVIILAAGTNDARRCTNLNMGMGDLAVSNTDNTNFTGAVNRILTYIEEANAVRTSAGKDAIKVVFVDLFYRGDISGGADKVKTYQGRIDSIVNMWENKWTQSTDPKLFQIRHNYLTADNAASLSADYLHLTRFAQGEFGSKLANELMDQGILTK